MKTPLDGRYDAMLAADERWGLAAALADPAIGLLVDLTKTGRSDPPGPRRPPLALGLLALTGIFADRYYQPAALPGHVAYRKIVCGGCGPRGGS
jgi:hypothetical protein